MLVLPTTHSPLLPNSSIRQPNSETYILLHLPHKHFLAAVPVLCHLRLNIVTCLLEKPQKSAGFQLASGSTGVESYSFQPQTSFHGFPVSGLGV